MEPRCAWRSTNISETSRFELSISYIVRLVASSSTEKVQSRRFALFWTIKASTGWDYVALPTDIYADSINLFRSSARGGPRARQRSGPDGRLARCRWRRQHPRCPVQWEHVGRDLVGADARRTR